MHILETSLATSLEEFRQIYRKAPTLSYIRKLHNYNEICTKVRHVDSWHLA